MTNTLSFTYDGTSTDPFDDLFIETHGGTKASWETDDELPEFDEMDDRDE